jgi:hypothetical protein
MLSAPAIRNIVAQPKSTVYLPRIMDDGRILIVKLFKGALGEGRAHLIGALITTGLAHAALSRTDTPKNERRVFHLYADEFQSFATESFALILSEARKYGLTLTIGHQYLGQLSDRPRQAVLGNAGPSLPSVSVPKTLSLSRNTSVSSIIPSSMTIRRRSCSNFPTFKPTAAFSLTDGRFIPFAYHSMTRPRR